jgi:hypothetical protein
MISNIYPIYDTIALLNNLTTIRYEIISNFNINEIINQAEKNKNKCNCNNKSIIFLWEIFIG